MRLSVLNVRISFLNLPQRRVFVVENSFHSAVSDWLMSRRSSRYVSHHVCVFNNTRAAVGGSLRRLGCRLGRFPVPFPDYEELLILLFLFQLLLQNADSFRQSGRAHLVEINDAKDQHDGRIEHRLRRRKVPTFGQLRI